MSDYPMLISNKLHSFRNFLLQRYDFFCNCINYVYRHDSTVFVSGTKHVNALNFWGDPCY